MNKSLDRTHPGFYTKSNPIKPLTLKSVDQPLLQMLEKNEVPNVKTHSRYSEVNKSFDSFLTQKKARESSTPMAGRAQFFQNRIEEKATGKSAEYYHQMEHAMNEHRVYELSKVRSSIFRECMSRRGYFEKENEHLKTHKIKILGRSRQATNQIECEGRNRLIRRMRNYVPDVRFTGKATDFTSVTPLTIANMFPETFFTSKPNLALIARDADYHPRVQCFSSETCQTALEKFTQLEEHLHDTVKQNLEDNGVMGDRGVWICKPGSSCRGKGIEVHNSRHQIIKYIVDNPGCVVQKYIEQPFLVDQRKFDIRQWFLVTSWSPLELHIYDEAYCRFSKEQFSLDNLDKFIHLTNQAIQSKTAVFEPLEKLRPGQSYLPPKVEATLIPDHQVWSTERLGSFIDEQLDQPNVYQNFIKREIHDVILDAAKRNSYHTRQVDGCFELYGADIVLDANLKPWLIEVNRCPSMSTDNPVLDRMIPEMIEDMIEIVIDKKLENRLKPLNKFILYDDLVQYDVSSSIADKQLPLTTTMPTPLTTTNTSILSMLIS